MHIHTLYSSKRILQIGSAETAIDVGIRRVPLGALMSCSEHEQLYRPNRFGLSTFTYLLTQYLYGAEWIRGFAGSSHESWQSQPILNI